MPARLLSALRTSWRSRSILVTMSAKILSSSAPGTPWRALAGMMAPAKARRSLVSWSDSMGGTRSTSLIKKGGGGQALLDGVGDVERQRLDGRGRIHAARRHPDAAVDHEQSLHVVAAAPFIDHRALGIGAHARRAHQVPAGVQHRRLATDVL